MRKGSTDSSQTGHSEWFASEDTARHWQHAFTTSCLIRAASQWTSQDFTNADSQPPLRALLIAANAALKAPSCASNMLPAALSSRMPRHVRYWLADPDA